MSIISLQFLVFVLGVILCYFIVPKKWQWVVLFIANILFYISFGLKYIGYILFTSVVTYLTALKLAQVSKEGKESIAVAAQEQKRNVRVKIIDLKSRICKSAIFLAVGIWVVVKYGNFIIDNINAVLKFLHISSTTAACLPTPRIYFSLSPKKKSQTPSEIAPDSCIYFLKISHRSLLFIKNHPTS